MANFYMFYCGILKVIRGSQNVICNIIFTKKIHSMFVFIEKRLTTCYSKKKKRIPANVPNDATDQTS